jgi:hypothetical protein
VLPSIHVTVSAPAVAQLIAMQGAKAVLSEMATPLVALLTPLPMFEE